MKKQLFAIGLSVVSMCSLLGGEKVFAYDRDAAATYANKYSSDKEGTDSYNKNYPSFPSDCTNFASQCVLEGGITKKKLPKKKVYPKHIGKTYMTKEYWSCELYDFVDYNYPADLKYFVPTSTWTLVDQSAGQDSYGFQDFMMVKKNKNVNVIGASAKDKVMTKFINNCNRGDVIQIKKVKDTRFSHSYVVYKKKKNKDGKIDLYLCAHTGNRKGEKEKDSLRTMIDKGIIEDNWIIAQVAM